MVTRYLDETQEDVDAKLVRRGAGEDLADVQMRLIKGPEIIITLLSSCHYSDGSIVTQEEYERWCNQERAEDNLIQ